MDIFRIDMDRARLNTPLRQVLEVDGRRQTWLAERLGVDPRQVWGWVHGLHIPSLETRVRIAELVGREVHELWPDDEQERAAA